MPTWEPIQHGFSSGEISSRMDLRSDSATYAYAAQRMDNFMPKPQGSAERVPGTRYLREIEDTTELNGEQACRIFQFDDALERKILAIFTDKKILLLSNIDTAPATQTITQPNVIGTLKNIVQNSSFDNGLQFWKAGWRDGGRPINPPVPAPVYAQNGQATIITHIEYERQEPTVKTEQLFQRVFVDEETNRFQLIVRGDYGFDLVGVPGNNLDVVPTDAVTFQIQVSTSNALDGDLYTSQTFTLDLTNTDRENRDVIVLDIPIDAPTPDFQGALWVSVVTTYGEPTILPPDPDAPGDWPLANTVLRGRINIQDVAFLASGPPITGDPDEPTQGDPSELVAYDDFMLQDLQFVRSPYDNKELVITHPNVPPARLYFDRFAGTFIIERIKFKVEQVDPDGDAVDPPVDDYVPPEWIDGSYPGSCWAYQGRLMLGGAGINSETVYTTVSGDWDNFFDIRDNAGRPDPASVFPDSALKFTTTIRSPIQWLAGQNDFFVGCEELEYKVMSQQALLRPGDIDARVQTSHGSIRVQPLNIATGVVFATDRGRKVRVLQGASNEYFAADKTILHPEVCAVGIRRMAFVRNPHHMVVCVLNDGTIALFHYEPEYEFEAWSRYTTNGRIIDVTLVRDEQRGYDVPLLAVERRERVYLESIPAWTDGNDWTYMDSYVNFVVAEPDYIFTGLDHLEGQTVVAIGDGIVIGDLSVRNGQIALVDGYNEPILVSNCTVGLPKPCVVETMPAITDQTTGGAGSKKRYTSIGVRLRESRVPLINGIRPPVNYDRRIMDSQLPRDQLVDVEVGNLGYSVRESITIEETEPVRIEVLGVYGKLGSNSL